MDKSKQIEVRFFSQKSGVEPVRDWLITLDKEDRKRVGVDLKTAEFGWPIGMPVCRPLGKSIYEVRSSLTQGRIARVLFCITGSHMVLLHAFIKKTKKTPAHEIDLALKRKKELMNGKI
ncbi:MAG: type II toxin-antitoxin system RelE/ParE family toxin [Pseudomonadota bacterium]